MKRFRRILALCMCVLTMSVMSVGAFAANGNETVASVSEENTIEPRTAFEYIHFTNLGVNYFHGASHTVYIDSGTVLNYDLSWSPASQKCKIGFRNVDTGEYYAYEYTGGAAAGIRSLNIPEGEYTVGVINSYGNTRAITGTLRYGFE